MKVLLLCLMIIFTGCAHMSPAEKHCHDQLTDEVTDYMLTLDNLKDQTNTETILQKEFIRRAKNAGIKIHTIDNHCTMLLIWRHKDDKK